MQILSKIPVLVPGNLNSHARRRVSETFQLLDMQSSAPADVTDEIAAAARGIASMTTISAEFIDKLPHLEIIANFGVGYDAVDAGHAARRGVVVTNTPDVLTEEVADTTIGLLLNTVRELSAAEKYLRDGNWTRLGNYRLTPLTMRGRKIGIFGMGRIGRAIARRLEAFGLMISYHNRRPQPDLAYQYHPTLLEMCEAVDTLIVVVPGGEGTRDAVDAAVLSALGKDGVLINIGRGSAVDEDALEAALRTGTIAAAGLDVFKREPHVPAGLISAPNLVLLPHVGSASVHTRNAMADLCVDNLVSWFSGKGALTPVPETPAGLRN